jgi:hypothetical protein
MYHFKKSFNPNYKTLDLALELCKNHFSWTNYEFKIKAKKIKNFNKWKKIFISYFLIWVFPTWKMVVSTPLQKRRNEFHLLNI